MAQRYESKGEGMEEYNINPDFKEYVDRYCITYKITPEQAVQHKLVQSVETEYRHKRQHTTISENLI